MDEAAVLDTFTLLHERELVKAGLSSAGVLTGAMTWLAEQTEPEREVCVCADGEERCLEALEPRSMAAVGEAAVRAAGAALSPVMAAMQRI
ncbi:hypothetical protein [Hyphomonas sp.]|uniref:hypothetical protein n=1 Tax=Hyphomonas sp. TaxID=87 RepID=UPI001BCAA396|nr:hypothetical protein [Hyphomonas sp.]